ncbi:cullin-1-like [Cloeon dipterum]|uniref:cullin-1-like n=1 Tax=Cloeon dipterum TaxID=197152 RepID=UPI00321FDE03
MSVDEEKLLFQMWALAEPTVNNILLQKTPVTPSAWIETYHRIYSMCVSEPWCVGESLFKRIEICLKSQISKIHQDLKKKSDLADYLKAFNNAWKQYSKACELLNNLFQPLNNHAKIYANESNCAQREDIKHLGFNMWKNAFYETKLINQIVDLMLEGFKDPRRGFLSDEKQKIMIEVLKSFKDLDKIIPSEQLVHEEATTLLLEGLKNSYTPLFVEFSKEIDSFVEYLDKAISFWKNEEKLCSLLFDSGSVEKLKASFADNLIEQKEDRMLSECQLFVEERRYKDFACIHAKIEQFYQKPNTRLVPIFHKFFKKMAFENLSREKKEEEALEEMCKMYMKHRKELVEKDLGDHPLFVTALEEALKDVANQIKSDPNESAKRLVNFCVSVLLSKEPEEEELDVKLDFTRVLYQNLENKDVFENYYLLHLSKRLLTGTSRTIELEEKILSRFDVRDYYH